ncbi:hypothetical protein [Streptomyces tauricus]|uniref:hypothetical protein n=1 Tax=Streptomyces tauricus TaxID=68274 RepID=UPI00343A59CE
MTTDPTPETARYRRRSEAEAVQWTGTNESALSVFCSPFDFQTIEPEDRVEDPDQTAAVRTHPHGGWVGLAPGDWVVREAGRYTRASDEEFRADWEPVSAGPAPATDRAELRGRIAALFRNPPGGERLGDATPGEIADAVLAELRERIAEVWVVWREDESAHGYFATEDAAKQATIDCWEEDEPSCPDYSWRRDGPRWELVVGGEHGGVYASRHKVHGTPAAPVLPAPVDPAAIRATALRWAADQAYRRARRLDEQEHDERAQGAWDVENTIRAGLRRMADETQQPETRPDFITRVLELFSLSHADAYGELFWRVEDATVHLSANVSDVFAWGGADSEPITPDTLAALEQAYADLKAVGGEDFLADLYAARQRGQRPQGAAYPSGTHEAWRQVSALYDACGPERELGIGNPKPAPAAPAAVAQPDKEAKTTPVLAYGGKGRVWCVKCPRPPGEDVPFAAGPVNPWELCAGCERPVVEVAEAADKEPDGNRIVAYRSPLPGALSVYCTRHTSELGDGALPLTSDDLPDGGMCAGCGVDVLIPQGPSGGTS